jgi:hypothetical protein
VLIENLPGTENHHFNEFEMRILIVLKISRNSQLKDMLILKNRIHYFKPLKSMNLLRHA